MKTLVTGVMLLGIFAMPATAENRFDRRIDQAAADIVAAKMGDLRGGFSYDAEPAMLFLPDFGSTASIPAQPAIAVSAQAWTGGLAPAVEKKVNRIVF